MGLPGLIAVCILAFCLLVPNASEAHEPEDVVVTYDVITHILTVNITHVVVNGSTHYINRTEIYLNGELFLYQNFTNQTDDRKVILDYQATPPNGSLLRVRVMCNQGGEKSVSIDIPTAPPIPTHPENGKGPSTFVIILIAFLLITIPTAVLLWWNRKMKRRYGNV